MESKFLRFIFPLLLFWPCLILADIGLNEQLDLEKQLFLKLDKLKTPDVFAKTEKWNWTSGERPSSLIYGNSEIGYFSSKNFELLDKQLELTLIPPSFKKPIEFFAVLKSGTKRKLGSKKFENAYAAFFEPLISVKDSPSFPFIMTNATARTLPAVINKLGEVVWIYDHKTKDISATDLLPNGDILILIGNIGTRAIVVNPFGKVRYDIDFASRNIPYPSTHTVQYLPKTNEILFITHDCREISRWTDPAPIFQGVQGWIRRFTLPRRSYMGSKIVRMSLDTQQVKEVWSSFDNFSPSESPSLAAGYLHQADRFMDARNPEQYNLFLQQKDFFTWLKWPNQYCNVDWTHENSAQYIEGKGYLVSIRNLNQIIFLDENGKMKWNIGEGSGHTYNIPMDGQAFSMQHSAVYLSDNRILLYDNHTPYRGMTGVRIGNRVSILTLPPSPGVLDQIWSVSLQSPHSAIRGAVSPVGNDRIFSYSAGDPGVWSDFFEIDIKSKKSVGKISYRFFSGFKGFEAKPLWGFAGDQYLGQNSESNLKDAPLDQSPPQDFLQFSY